MTVNGVTYTPDRQNLMSYFGGFNLSPGQIAMVQNSICDPSRAPLVSAPQARCRDVTLIATATACTATGLTTAQVDNGSFDPNGLPITLSLDRTGPFPVGDDAGDAHRLRRNLQHAVHRQRHGRRPDAADDHAAAQGGGDDLHQRSDRGRRRHHATTTAARRRSPVRSSSATAWC